MSQKLKSPSQLFLQEITRTNTAFFVIIALNSKMGSASRFFVTLPTVRVGKHKTKDKTKTKTKTKTMTKIKTKTKR